MPRLRQVGRADTEHPTVHASYDFVFGEGRDPAAGARTATGSSGDWWSVFALVPDVLEHAIGGFMLYRSPARLLPAELRELAQTRVGWASGSSFVYSQHCKSLRGLGVPEAKIVAVASWAVADCFDRLERAVLAYADALVFDRGRVDDAVFEVLRGELSDEQILELTYIAATYTMHATIARALRLENDDVAEPVAEEAAPDGFDARRFAGAPRDPGDPPG
jgi:alkylhydroperoxidase family enzyme